MALNPLRAARIGNLRDRVILQRYVHTVVAHEEDGVFVKDEFEWQDVATVYARVEPLRGDSIYEDQIKSKYSRQQFAVSLRYRADVVPVLWRVLWVRDAGQAPHVLQVEGVTNPDERRRFLRLLCEQVNSQQEAA